MKKIIIFCFLALSVFSCSSDDGSSDDVTGNPEDILVRKIVTNNYNSFYTTIFQYDGKKIVSLKSRRFRNEFLYSGDNIVEFSHFYDVDENGNGGNLYAVTDFEYNSDGTLKSFTQIEEEVYIVQVVFTYNPDNMVQFDSYNNAGEGGSIVDLHLVGTGKMYVENNKVIKVDNNNTNEWFYLKYDNKNHPMKNVIGYNKLFLYGIFHPSFHDEGCSSNPGTVNNDLQIQADGVDYITIEYNNANFPKKITYDTDGYIVDELYY